MNTGLQPIRIVRNRIEVLDDGKRFYACLLGKLWFSIAAIANETGLTPNQVAYILHREGVSVRRGRDMMTKESHWVVRQTRKGLGIVLKRELIHLRTQRQKQLTQGNP